MGVFGFWGERRGPVVKYPVIERREDTLLFTRIRGCSMIHEKYLVGFDNGQRFFPESTYLSTTPNPFDSKRLYVLRYSSIIIVIVVFPFSGNPHRVPFALFLGGVRGLEERGGLPRGSTLEREIGDFRICVTLCYRSR